MLLTLEGHREIERSTGRFLRVLVSIPDGHKEDVTARCITADDKHGWVLCYRHNAEGRPYLDGPYVAKELLVGDVVFVDGTRGREAA